MIEHFYFYSTVDIQEIVEVYSILWPFSPFAVKLIISLVNAVFLYSLQSQFLGTKWFLTGVALQVKLGGTYWDETGCSVDTRNPFQTWVKPVLVCSVNKP